MTDELNDEHKRDAARNNVQKYWNEKPERSVPYYGQPTAEYAGSYYGRAASDGELFGEITLQRLLRVIQRKWLTITLSAVFFLAMAVLYLLTATKIYQASTIVELSVRRPRISGNQGAIIDDSRNYRTEEVFNTRLERLKGETMFELAATEFLAARGPVDMERNALKRWLKRKSDFTLIRRSQLMKMSFEDPDPEMAALGADIMAKAAEKLAYEENRRDSEKAVEWLTEQAAGQKGNMGKVDRSLLELRAENNIDVLETQRKTIADSMLDYNKTMVGIESEAVLAQDLCDLLAVIEGEPEKSGQLPPDTPRLEEIRSAMDRWILSQAELNSLLTRYTEQHPKVKSKLEESAACRAQVVSAINRSKQSAESNLRLLKKQVQSLSARVEQLRHDASEMELKIVKVHTQLQALEREREAAEISYKGILNRMEEARLSADETTTTIKVVEWAALPSSPVKPRPFRVLLIMICIGLLVGGALAMFADSLEDHVASSMDIEQNLGLKVLGLVPRVHDVGERKDMARLSLVDKFSQVAEAFAGVRAILDSSQYKETSQSILVASTMPEEGKTIVSCNLAIMSAKSGKKTLLIDMDLRRPRVGNIWKMPEKTPSLISVLAEGDAARFDALPFETDCPNLSVVGSRAVTNVSPAELLGGHCVRQFIEWARSHYERVVIDSPPYGIVSDAVVFAGSTGCVVLVCRPGRSRRKALRHAMQHFQEVGANLIGVVVNDVDFKKDSYFSNYDHAYGYGDRYGYQPQADDAGD